MPSRFPSIPSEFRGQPLQHLFIPHWTSPTPPFQWESQSPSLRHSSLSVRGTPSQIALISMAIFSELLFSLPKEFRRESIRTSLQVRRKAPSMTNGSSLTTASFSLRYREESRSTSLQCPMAITLDDTANPLQPPFHSKGSFPLMPNEILSNSSQHSKPLLLDCRRNSLQHLLSIAQGSPSTPRATHVHKANMTRLFLNSRGRRPRFASAPQA